MKAPWHSGKSSVTLLIFLKSGAIMVQRPVKWINDKAKNKSIATKLPSRKQMIQWFGWRTGTMVDKAPDLVQGKPAFHPNHTPYTSYENSGNRGMGFISLPERIWTLGKNIRIIWGYKGKMIMPERMTQRAKLTPTNCSISTTTAK